MYKTNDDLPPAVLSALPTARLRTAWRMAFAAALKQYGKEEQAFKVAWAAVARIATKGPDGKWKVKAGKEKPAGQQKSVIAKGLAVLASMLGAEDLEDARRIRAYDDAQDEAAALEKAVEEGEFDDVAEETGAEGAPGQFPKRADVQRALRAALPATTGNVIRLAKVVNTTPAGQVAIIKADPERRLITAWSTVISKGGVPVVDLQGHVISAEEMEQAYHRYAIEERLGNDDHAGPDTSVLVEGMCLTKTKQDLLGIDLGMEGYLGVWKIMDDAVWERVKKGERLMMSIEGTAFLDELPEAA